jgi:hypothetical protein
MDELWQPVDLKRPVMRLALGVHVYVEKRKSTVAWICGDLSSHPICFLLAHRSRNGEIRHLMPSVDLCFGSGLHRNRGLCSVPRAHAWIDFTTSLDEWENYRIVASEKKMTDDVDESWATIGSTEAGVITDALERTMVCLAESAPDEMGEGSHFINVPLECKESDALECPKTGYELRAILDDDDFLESPAPAPGVLQVAVSASMAGSESQYLPDTYKSLYNDETLRNPLYEKFKQRQEVRNQQK